MKSNKFNKLLSGLSVLTALLMMSGGAQAGIATTKHNLGSGGSTNTYSGTSEICVFCHTPHGADTSASVPLWNKDLSAAPAYTTYDSLGTSSLDGAVMSVGSVSIACLSCHDGTQAMDSALNDPGSGTTVASYTGGTWAGTGVDTTTGLMTNAVTTLGADLQNDHPVGIQYGGGGHTASAPAGALKDGDFTPADHDTVNSNDIWWVDTEGTPNGTREKTDMQLYTRTLATVDQPFVECASCHDPHTNNTTFLRISNAGSAVCLACHTK